MKVATSTILYVREKKKLTAASAKKDKKTSTLVTSKAAIKATQETSKTTPEISSNPDQTSGVWSVVGQITLGAFLPGIWNLVRHFEIAPKARSHVRKLHAFYAVDYVDRFMISFAKSKRMFCT